MVIEEIEFWENVKNYDKEINSIFKGKSNLKKIINEIKNKNKKIIADFGCGIGNSLELIKDFKKIYAIDFSENMLKQAKNKNKKIKNIKYIKNNLNNCQLPEKVDYALAINAIFPKNFAEFDIYFENILNNVKKNGKLILLLASFEAYTFLLQMIAKQKFETNKNPQIVINEINEIVSKHNYSPFGYIISDSNRIEKKWLKEEIEFRLSKYNLKKTKITKLEISFPNDNLKKEIPELKRWYWLIKIKK